MHRPWGQCARLRRGGRWVDPPARLLPGPHVLRGRQSWALARCSLAETGFSFGEFLSEAVLWIACLPWARFALPSRAGRWVAVRTPPQLLTPRWTVVCPGPPAWMLAGPLAAWSPLGCPPHFSQQYPPTVPLGLPRSPPRGAPTSGHPEEVALWAFVTLRRDVSTAPGGTPCGRLHRPLTLHSELRAQGPAGGSSHPRWVGAPCSGALGMVLQAA